MIKSITVTNYLGESIRLDLMRPEESGFAVIDVTGLGPGKADINYTETSVNDGALFNSSRIPSRNIVISLKYLWKNTIEDARQLSYKYFPIKRKVTLTIETDNRTSMIEGYVESNDPAIFSNSEGSDISIICPNPFFYAAYGSNSVYLANIKSAFEFPFSNESLTESLIEMSSIMDQADAVVVYEGDYEVGVTIILRASAPAKNITIYNVTARETMTINTDIIETLTGSGLDEGDEIVISTVTGSKYVRLVRDGVTTNILNCVDRNSSWFKISKGENIFAYTAEEGANNLEFEIQHRIIYEGV